MKEIKLKIEQKHIDNGITCDINRCMVALALKDHFQTLDACSYISGGYYKKKRLSYSNELINLILNFDSGKNIKPCEMIIYEN